MDDVVPSQRAAAAPLFKGHAILLSSDIERDGYFAPNEGIIYPVSIDLGTVPPLFNFTADAYSRTNPFEPVKKDFYQTSSRKAVFVPSWSLLLAKGKDSLPDETFTWLVASPIRMLIGAYIDASTHMLRIPVELINIFRDMKKTPQEVSRALQAVVARLQLPFPFKSTFHAQLREHGAEYHFRNLLKYDPCVIVSPNLNSWPVKNVASISSTFPSLYGDLRVPVEILDGDDLVADAQATQKHGPGSAAPCNLGVIRISYAAGSAVGPAAPGRPPAVQLADSDAPMKTDGDEQSRRRRVAALRYVVTAERQTSQLQENSDYVNIDILPDFVNEGPRVRSVGYGAPCSPMAMWQGGTDIGKGYSNIFDAVLQDHANADAINRRTPLPPTWALAMSEAFNAPGGGFGSFRDGVQLAVSSQTVRQTLYKRGSKTNLPEARQSKCTVNKSLLAITGARCVLDAASAYGDRAFAALALPQVVRYVGVDCNPDLFGPYSAHPKALLDIANGFGNPSDLDLTEDEVTAEGIKLVPSVLAAEAAGSGSGDAAVAAARWITHPLPPRSDLHPLRWWHEPDGLRNETGGYRRLLKVALPLCSDADPTPTASADGVAPVATTKASRLLRAAARCAFSCDMFQTAYIPPHPPVLGLGPEYSAPPQWVDPHQPAAPVPDLAAHPEALFDLALVSPAPYRTETYSTGTGQASNVSTLDEWFASYFVTTMWRCYHRVRVGGFIAVTFLDRLDQSKNVLHALEKLLLATEALCPGAIYSGAVGWHGTNEHVPYFLFMKSDINVWDGDILGGEHLVLPQRPPATAVAPSNASASAAYTDPITRLRLRRSMVLRTWRRAYPETWTHLLLHAMRVRWPIPAADAMDALVRASGTPRLLRPSGQSGPVDLRVMPALWRLAEAVERSSVAGGADDAQKPPAKRGGVASASAAKTVADIFAPSAVSHRWGVETFAEMFDVAASATAHPQAAAARDDGITENAARVVAAVYDSGPLVPSFFGVSNPLALKVAGADAAALANGDASYSVPSSLAELCTAVDGTTAGVTGPLSRVDARTLAALYEQQVRSGTHTLKGIVSGDTFAALSGEWFDAVAEAAVEAAEIAADAARLAGGQPVKRMAPRSAQVDPAAAAAAAAIYRAASERWTEPRGGPLNLIRSATKPVVAAADDVYAQCGDAGVPLTKTPASTATSTSIASATARASVLPAGPDGCMGVPAGQACTRTPFAAEVPGQLAPHVAMSIPSVDYDAVGVTALDPSSTAQAWWTAHIPLPPPVSARTSALVVPSLGEVVKLFAFEWSAQRIAENNMHNTLRVAADENDEPQDDAAAEDTSHAATGGVGYGRKTLNFPPVSAQALDAATRSIIGPARAVLTIGDPELFVLRYLALHLRKVRFTALGPYRATGVVPLPRLADGSGHRDLLELHVPARDLRRLVNMAGLHTTARAVSLAIVLLQLPYPFKSSFTDQAYRPPRSVLKYAQLFAESVWEARCKFDNRETSITFDGLITAQCDPLVQTSLPFIMPHDAVVAASTAQGRAGDVQAFAAAASSRSRIRDAASMSLLEAAVTRTSGQVVVSAQDTDDYTAIDFLPDVWTEGDRLLARKVMGDNAVRPAPVAAWVHPAHHHAFVPGAVQLAVVQGLPLDNYVLREGLFRSEHAWLECTQFKVTQAIAVMKLLCPAAFKDAKWLDMSSGWGDRLVAATALGVGRYVGVDPNPALAGRYIDMVACLDPNATVAVLDAAGTDLLPPVEGARVQRDGSDETVALSEADPTSPWRPGVSVTDAEAAKYCFVQSGFETSSAALKKMTDAHGLFDIVYSSPPFFDYELYGHHRDGQSMIDATLADSGNASTSFGDELVKDPSMADVPALVDASASDTAGMESPDPLGDSRSSLIKAVALGRADIRRIALGKWVVDFFFRSCVIAADAVRVGGIVSLYIVDTCKPRASNVDPLGWGYGFTEPALALVSAFEPRLRYRGCVCARGEKGKLRPTWVFERVEPLEGLRNVVDAVARVHAGEPAAPVAASPDTSPLAGGSDETRRDVICDLPEDEREAWMMAVKQRFLLGRLVYERVMHAFECSYPGVASAGYPLTMTQLRQIITGD